MSSIQGSWPAVTQSLQFRALELAGETGEVVEKVKKVWRDRGGVPNTEDFAGICKEMGDVLICLSNLATQMNVQLDDIAKIGMDKMKARIATNTVQGSGDNREVRTCGGTINAPWPDIDLRQVIADNPILDTDLTRHGDITQLIVNNAIRDMAEPTLVEVAYDGQYAYLNQYVATWSDGVCHGFTVDSSEARILGNDYVAEQARKRRFPNG